MKVEGFSIIHDVKEIETNQETVSFIYTSSFPMNAFYEKV